MSLSQTRQAAINRMGYQSERDTAAASILGEGSNCRRRLGNGTLGDYGRQPHERADQVVIQIPLIPQA